MGKRRIVYITGMKPKPDPEAHRPALLRVLQAALERVDTAAASWLNARAENFTLVSWTREFYQEQRDFEVDRPGIERLLGAPAPTAADRRAADALPRRLMRWWHLLGDSYPWLSRVVVSPALKATLADVRRYVDNVDGVGDRVRSYLIDALLAGFRSGERIMLVGHSLGSVIAYDCLWQLSREAREPGRCEVFLSLGSPLATRFIRQGLLGAKHTPPECYPDNIDAWINVAARGEMVALHRRIKPFFGEMLKLGLVQTLEDWDDIYNHFRDANGLNTHKSYGYLNHPAVAGLIAQWLSYSSSGSMRTSMRRLRSRP